MTFIAQYRSLSPRMKVNIVVLTMVVALKLLFVPLSVAIAADGTAAKPQETAAPAAAAASKADYTEQGLYDAAYDFCATVQNRSGASCDCEQKLLKQPERFGEEERVMAFYYFTDKERYIKEFEARRTADPKWQEDFSLRMSNMQALIIAACGA